MNSPVTSLRIDPYVKQHAKPILSEIGLNLSASVNLFLKAVIRCNGIPFDLRLTSDSPTAPLDFVAEYISPIMSPRNEQSRLGATPDRTRSRLLKRRELINQDRKSIF